VADVKIFGHTMPKWAAVATAVGGAAVVVYVIRARSTAASASTSTATPVDTSGTGYGYGTSGGYGYGYSYASGDGSYASAYTATSASYGDNAAWAQAAESGLSTIGFSPTDVATALGRYLDRQSLSTSQAAIVEAAIAEYGAPPVGTYQVILASSRTPVTTGTSAPKAAPGAVTTGTSASDLTVSWASVNGAAHYQVEVSGPLAGTKADPTVTATHAVFEVATAGTNGTVRVRAGNSAGWGPWSASKSFKFPAKSDTPVKKQ
jgi:hypothetical protein